ncbi:MAG: hypothetical protein WCP20_11440 [Desulfuromonadales bacterium]
MRVKISTIEFEVRNTLPGVKSMVAQIDEALLENGLKLDHLIVDGVVVTDTPFDHVKQNRKDIKEVEVIFVTEDQKKQKIKDTKVTSNTKASTIRVTISNIVFEVNRTLPGVSKMFSQIDASMKDFDVYFSHLIVDGSEVNDEPREYMFKNLKSIRNVEVIFLTSDQYILQVMGIMDSFLGSALPALKAVANEFYGKPNDETWSRLETCLNGISSLLGIINSMVSIPELAGRTERFASLGESIGLHLDNFNNAAKLNDHTLMADIMLYEMVPFVESLHAAVSQLLEREISVHH